MKRNNLRIKPEDEGNPEILVKTII